MNCAAILFVLILSNRNNFGHGLIYRAQLKRVLDCPGQVDQPVRQPIVVIKLPNQAGEFFSHHESVLRFFSSQFSIAKWFCFLLPAK